MQLLKWSHFNWQKLNQANFLKGSQKENEDVCSIHGLSNTVMFSETQLIKKSNKDLRWAWKHTQNQFDISNTQWGYCLKICTLTAHLWAEYSIYTFIYVASSIISYIWKYIASSLHEVNLLSTVPHFTWKGVWC